MGEKRGHSSRHILVLIQKYCAVLAARRYSPKSIDSYRRSLLDFLAFLRTRQISRITDVTRQHLDAYRLHLVERRFKPASVYAYMRAARMFFRYLRKSQHIFIDPAENLVIGTPQRRLQRIPSEAEVRRLLDAVDTSGPTGIRDKALLETAYSTGLRREEMLRLETQSIDATYSSVRVIGKGNKERVVPVGATARTWLRQYIEEARPKLLKEETHALWISRITGKALTYHAIHMILMSRCAAAGISPVIGAHSLRRACATHMLQHGAHPVQIQMLLGHAAMQHLSQYLRVSIKELKKMHEGSNPGR